ncbi:MAG: hypothetical protein HYY67_03245 [Thaumarchaeota archaeon]|nr:hypothetical protein [Nitrososphaerota archaeon]
MPQELAGLQNASDKGLNEVLFSDLLRKSVIDATKDVLGEALARRVLNYLRMDNTENILEVSTFLHSMCGDTGASIVERAIVKDLFERADIEYIEDYGMDFELGINIVRQRLTEVCIQTSIYSE